MDQDSRIDQILEITKDTNRTMHKMRRSMLWGRFVYIIVWLILILGPAAAYYFYFQSYVQPYVNKLQQLESQLQAANKTTQTYQSEISSFFGNFAPHASSTSATSTGR